MVKMRVTLAARPLSWANLAKSVPESAFSRSRSASFAASRLAFSILSAWVISAVASFKL